MDATMLTTEQPSSGQRMPLLLQTSVESRGEDHGGESEEVPSAAAALEKTGGARGEAACGHAHVHADEERAVEACGCTRVPGAAEAAAGRRGALEPTSSLRCLSWNLAPDEAAWVVRCRLVLHVKFLKLVVAAVLVTVATRELSCALPGWSCVKNYGPAEYFEYYWSAQCCDLLVLFFVGRVYERRGADTPLFLVMCLLGALFPSAQETIPFMRVSLSLYAIHCQWQMATWIWVIAEVLIVLVIAAKHVRYAISNRLALVWGLETCALVSVLIGPNVADTAFHFHHWIFAWILAMVARFEPLWSVATQAFFIGYYLNGIAIYGRHPVLACKEVYFLSDQQGCTLGKNTTNGTQPIYEPPNPWNCSGDYARRSGMP